MNNIPHKFQQPCTGSAQYSVRAIADGWKKIGWCGSDKGLRKKSDCRYNTSLKTWKCVNKKQNFLWQGIRGGIFEMEKS